jgi:hypothetical protein
LVPNAEVEAPVETLGVSLVYGKIQGNSVLAGFLRGRGARLNLEIQLERGRFPCTVEQGIFQMNREFCEGNRDIACWDQH